MRVVIAGAGSVGRSIARELSTTATRCCSSTRSADDDQARPGARRRAGCSPTPARSSSLEEARLAECDVVVAATGDDKANLVVSLLAKTEFGVPRTVGRVNNPKNEWMFDEAWGVDVAVSTPRLMTALVEEAVSVGDLVRIFQFQQAQATMVELTLPAGQPVHRRDRVGDVAWPADTVLVGIIREDQPIAPSRDDSLEANDELLFLTTPETEDELEAMLSPANRIPRGADE